MAFWPFKLPYGRSDTDISGREVGGGGISLSLASPVQQNQQTPHPLHLVPLRTFCPRLQRLLLWAVCWLRPRTCVSYADLQGPGSSRGFCCYAVVSLRLSPCPSVPHCQSRLRSVWGCSWQSEVGGRGGSPACDPVAEGRVRRVSSSLSPGGLWSVWSSCSSGTWCDTPAVFISCLKPPSHSCTSCPIPRGPVRFLLPC